MIYPICFAKHKNQPCVIRARAPDAGKAKFKLRCLAHAPHAHAECARKLNERTREHVRAHQDIDTPSVRRHPTPTAPRGWGATLKRPISYPAAGLTG